MILSSPLLLRSLRPPAPLLALATVALAARFHGVDIVRFLPFALFFIMCEPGVLLAKLVRTERDGIEIEYPLLVVRHFRYSEISAIEVRRTMFGLLTRVRIFPKDGFVIEIDGRSKDAEAFADLIGSKTRPSGERKRPLLQRLVDVSPIVLGVALAFGLKAPVHAFGLAAGVIAVLSWTMWGWRARSASR